MHTGNILKIECDQFIPADLLILHSSDKKGCCYVETKNLDGETNLKIKNAQKDLNYYFKNEKDLAGIDGELICEKPNNQIHKFEGQILIPQNQDKISLSAENVLLRGCSLKNTDFVYGLCIFTGHDSKLMQNSANAKYKFSTLEVMTNNAILLILTTQIIMSIIGSIVGSTWTFYNSKNLMNRPEWNVDTIPNWCYLTQAFYLELDKGKVIESGFPFFKKFCTWILIFTNLVPISLMVTADMVKLFQAIFMSNDVNMYDEEQDMAMRAQSSNLNEELGQVEYVFSDKTGTLTCNVMQFKKFSAGTKAYGSGNMPSEKQEANVCFHDDNLAFDLENEDALIRVVLFLATCHTIIIDQRKGTYNSASPDELALVNAAKQFGYEFLERDEFDNIVVRNNKNGDVFKYKLLNVCEFTSTRKRMSCIYRDPQGRIVLMCKGADAIVKDRLS